MRNRRSALPTLPMNVVSARPTAFMRQLLMRCAILALGIATATAQIQEFDGEGAVTGGGSTASAGDFELRTAIAQPGASGLQRGGQFALIGGVLGSEASSIVPAEIFSDGFEAKDVR